MLQLQLFFIVINSFYLHQVVTQTTESVENTIIEIFNKCKCVRYSQCDLNSITENIDARLDENKVLCKGGAFEGEFVCCKEADRNRKPTNDTSDKNSIACGVPKPKINPRIFNPDETELDSVQGEFPWIAAIFKNNGNGQYEFVASGSLIHPNVILTVNHRIYGIRAEDLKVVVNGEVELPVIGNKITEERNVVEIVSHEGYNRHFLYNDVALLILDKPYEEGKNFLCRICSPPKNINMENIKCVVAGWGEEINKKSQIKTLKKVELPWVPHNTCEQLLRNTRLGRSFKLHKSFVCAGGEKDKDACKGDGGSPLMCPYSPGENKYFLAGIVSWGIECGLTNVPGVYGNIEEFKQWVNDELKQRKLDDGWNFSATVEKSLMEKSLVV